MSEILILDLFYIKVQNVKNLRLKNPFFANANEVEIYYRSKLLDWELSFWFGSNFVIKILSLSFQSTYQKITKHSSQFWNSFFLVKILTNRWDTFSLRSSCLFLVKIRRRSFLVKDSCSDLCFTTSPNHRCTRVKNPGDRALVIFF